jgi:hypothetical protein
MFSLTSINADWIDPTLKTIAAERFGQPPPPELMMLARTRLLYGQDPPDTSSRDFSLSASFSGVDEIWVALF